MCNNTFYNTVRIYTIEISLHKHFFDLGIAMDILIPSKCIELLFRVI